MAEAPERDQKTEAPTQKRRADAARDGDVLHSRELATALTLAAGLVWLVLAGPLLVDSCKSLLKQGLTVSRSDLDVFDPALAAVRLLSVIIMPFAGLVVLCLIAALLEPIFTGSAGFRPQAFSPKASKINPISGLGRMFGMQGLIELAKALAKTVVLGLIGYWAIAGQFSDMTGLSRMDVTRAAGHAGQSLVMTVSALVAGLFLIAGIDLPVQYVRRNIRLRMTKQQVKEEMRQAEGSPEIKHAIRRRQQEVLSASARQGMARASVVLTNPTHFAVALRYLPGLDPAPIVVARGCDEVARHIRELANENSVPMLEYPTLARAIYYTTRAGEAISEDLYLAVATILAFVFNLDRAKDSDSLQPHVDVPPDKTFDQFGNRATP